MLALRTRALVGSKALRLGGMKCRTPGWDEAGGSLVKSMVDIGRD